MTERPDQADGDERWPCDDYLPPLTCFTTPKPKTLTCAGCRAAFPDGNHVRDLITTAHATLRAENDRLRAAGDAATRAWNEWSVSRHSIEPMARRREARALTALRYAISRLTAALAAAQPQAVEHD